MRPDAMHLGRISVLITDLWGFHRSDNLRYDLPEDQCACFNLRDFRELKLEFLKWLLR